MALHNEGGYYDVSNRGSSYAQLQLEKQWADEAQQVAASLAAWEMIEEADDYQPAVENFWLDCLWNIGNYNAGYDTATGVTAYEAGFGWLQTPPPCIDFKSNCLWLRATEKLVAEASVAAKSAFINRFRELAKEVDTHGYNCQAWTALCNNSYDVRSKLRAKLHEMRTDLEECAASTPLGKLTREWVEDFYDDYYGGGKK